jgi:hypothetical protein
MHKIIQMGFAFKSEGEDRPNSTVDSDGPSLSTVLEALRFNSNQKV